MKNPAKANGGKSFFSKNFFTRITALKFPINFQKYVCDFTTKKPRPLKAGATK